MIITTHDTSMWWCKTEMIDVSNEVKRFLYTYFRIGVSYCY